NRDGQAAAFSRDPPRCSHDRLRLARWCGRSSASPVRPVMAPGALGSHARLRATRRVDVLPPISLRVATAALRPAWAIRAPIDDGLSVAVDRAAGGALGG